MVRSGNPIGAAEVIRSANAMASVCGEVCPEEVFCQAACTRGKKDFPIAIRELHFHATQCEVRRGYSDPRPFTPNHRSVAVVGGGPAGLTCAFELAKFGYRIDLYDRKLPGGVPRNTIPSYRLSETEVRADVDLLSRFLDVHEEDIGRERFEEIRKRHDALFIAVGLSIDRALEIPGRDLPGVIPVLDFLESAKRTSQKAAAGDRVVIVGGGNVSLDAAATAKRLGSREVTLLYRRGEKEMRVWESELGEARAQGVQMHFLTNPVEIIGPDRVRGIRCLRTRLSDRRDATDRPIPLDIEGSEFTLEADTIIPAIGQRPGADFLELFDRTAQGFLMVDGSLSTSRPGVFAGGDLVGGEGTIVQSVGHGKKAANSIHQYLTEGAGP
jgi:NADPH-dependent glutamate synthase beta subunit-like oxidoreductase